MYVIKELLSTLARYRCVYENLISYLLTPWSTVLREKLTGFQLVKKFHAFYGTRRFITAFTSACPYPKLWTLN
jgi:hypothetical protein